MVKGKAYSTTLVFIQILTSAAIFLSGPIWVKSSILNSLFLLSGFMAVWAIYTIRFSNLKISPEVKKGAQLVTHGPYKFVRHPMYSSLLFATLVLILNYFTFFRLFLWIILFIDLLLKLSYEEKLLLEHYEDYANYIKQTKALIPFIY